MLKWKQDALAAVSFLSKTAILRPTIRKIMVVYHIIFILLFTFEAIPSLAPLYLSELSHIFQQACPGWTNILMQFFRKQRCAYGWRTVILGVQWRAPLTEQGLQRHNLKLLLSLSNLLHWAKCNSRKPHDQPQMFSTYSMCTAGRSQT